ncbi:MAG TPA: thioredoxin domain-containing protein [bacterium]|nr:thioredoxin domain-containing protein [bacterium]
MPNRLKDATSPYLRQHADNPVAWEEWGPEAFARAKAENKPVFLSVGYAACHWCHVMAHESFENEAIARQINEGFVPIKVDREERPDVDQIYQHAIAALGVGGGWPLTAFLTADGKPFYGGTYFPPEDRYGRPGLPKVLAGVREAWEQRREEVDAQAADLLDVVKEIEGFPEETGELVGDFFPRSAMFLLQRVDPENGGFGSAPKFPNSSAMELLLRHARRSGTESSRDAVLFTLGKMAEGGIWDHLGGGFHRYSVDERWHVPHFEKMLYDNAQLARSYCLGWQISGLPWCRHIATETLEYLLREMRSPEGAFYASTDADSAPPADPSAHAEEGEFFAWRLDEVEKVLGAEDAKVWAVRYEITGEGNWEDGKNVLHLMASEEDVAKETGRTPAEIVRVLQDGRTKLFAAREQRPKPFRDEKTLTSWNALAIGAFATCGAAFGRADFVEAAEKAADFFLERCWSNGVLLRAPKAAGHAPLAGTIDDYANLADACVDLWEATLSPRWLDRAAELAEAAKARFLGDDGTVYLTANDGEALVHRPLSLHDQSIPAGSGVITRCWGRLARLLGRTDFEEAAAKVLKKHLRAMALQPFAFATMACAWDDAAHPTDVVFAGPTQSEEAQSMLARLRARFVPGLALHLAPALVGAPARSPLAADKPPQGGRATVYVCRDRACSPPVTDPAALEQLL